MLDYIEEFGRVPTENFLIEHLTVNAKKVSNLFVSFDPLLCVMQGCSPAENFNQNRKFQTNLQCSRAFQPKPKVSIKVGIRLKISNKT